MPHLYTKEFIKDWRLGAWELAKLTLFRLFACVCVERGGDNSFSTVVHGMRGFATRTA